MGQARTHILPQERLSCEKERRFHKEIVPHPVGPNWDRTGLVAPVTIKYRIDLQELWSTGYGWEDILPGTIQQEWRENEEAINQLLTFKFDRKLKPDHAIGPCTSSTWFCGRRRTGEWRSHFSPLEAAGWKSSMRPSYCQALCRPAETENYSPT